MPLFMSMRVNIPDRLVINTHNPLKYSQFKRSRRIGIEQKRACALTFPVWLAIFP